MLQLIYMTTSPSNTKQYTNFYLTMLLLTTVFTGFGLAGLPETIRSLGYFSVAPVYIALQAINFIVLLISIIGLVLLFRKQKLGIIIALSTYAASFILTIALLFFVDQIVDYTFTSLSAAEVKEAGGQRMLESITGLILYITLLGSLVITLVYSTLWYFAWRGQQKADLTPKKPIKK